MGLQLITNGLDRKVFDALQLRDTPVRHSNFLCLPSSFDGHHFLPHLPKGLLERRILLRHRGVDQEQVEVVHPAVCQQLVAGLSQVPIQADDLVRDVELLSLVAHVEPLLDGLAHHVGVAIGLRQVQVAKAGSQGLEHGAVQLLLLLAVAQPCGAHTEGHPRGLVMAQGHLGDLKDLCLGHLHRLGVNRGRGGDGNRRSKTHV
mmetsp:Transcript_84436/g.103476  ORF Transcript_84436/g.103476 Transcript_84436/m.103476 type:complete len:203 (+) Transcript_84436:668-1276(+)